MNLLQYRDRLKIRQLDDKTQVWDPIRRKYLQLQPEELVRQLLLHYLMEERAYPKNRLALEHSVKRQQGRGRYDLLVYGPELQALMLCECKAPQHKLSDKTLIQVASYNETLQVPYFMICNGLEAYCLVLDYQQGKHQILTEIPPYQDLK